MTITISKNVNNNINCDRITRREKEVLYLLAHEYTTDMIAQELYISRHTVISHRKNLLEKLDVRNVAGMIRRAFELGFLCLHSERISSHGWAQMEYVALHIS